MQRQLDLATSLAQAIARHPLLRRTFRVLTAHDLIPAEHRETGRPMPLRDGLATMWQTWTTDEFVIDPSRITIEISRTGVDGDTFKHEHLMDRYGIQVNKTSRNTVLFMTNIGTSRSAIAYSSRCSLNSQSVSRRPRRNAIPRSAVAEIPMPPLPNLQRVRPGVCDRLSPALTGISAPRSSAASSAGRWSTCVTAELRERAAGEAPCPRAS